jgi:aerobic-type carbon monoxide dehydrogenase small subunit (CoxS/CutS family)
MAKPSDPGDPAREETATTSVSRRTFLKSAGVGAAATGLIGAAGETAAAAVLGPDPVLLALKVNGMARTVSVEPRVTLLRALRNHLDLTGAKEVCDRGACGACTVLLDGEPVCSCLMLAADAVGREVTTVEGLGTPEKLSPLQAAFVECDALQCGFCTPGFVVAAADLLARNPSPSEDEIREALSGNLCRCTGYQKIVEAVKMAAERA